MRHRETMCHWKHLRFLPEDSAMRADCLFSRRPTMTISMCQVRRDVMLSSVLTSASPPVLEFARFIGWPRLRAQLMARYLRKHGPTPSVFTTLRSHRCGLNLDHAQNLASLRSSEIRTRSL